MARILDVRYVITQDGEARRWLLVVLHFRRSTVLGAWPLGSAEMADAVEVALGLADPALVQRTYPEHTRISDYGRPVVVIAPGRVQVRDDARWGALVREYGVLHMVPTIPPLPRG